MLLLHSTLRFKTVTTSSLAVSLGYNISLSEIPELSVDQLYIHQGLCIEYLWIRLGLPFTVVQYLR